MECEVIPSTDLEACEGLHIESPPEWVGAVAEAKEDLASIRKKLVDLTRAQQRRVLNVFDSGSLDQRVHDCSDEISTSLRRCEQKVFRLKAHVAGSRHGQNAHTYLALQLQQATLQFKNAQTYYIGELQKRRCDSFQGSTVVEPGWDACEPHSGFSQVQLEQLEAMSESASQRNAEIQHIHDSVSQLSTIFKELAVLVIDQGSILDRIDYNIEDAATHAHDARVAIDEARKAQRSNRSMKCILLLSIVNVMLIFVLVVKTRHE
jgi:syntaxin 16